MGKIEDIRLLELFNAYCDRKFNQIAQRLNLLSGDEVFDYLQAIARLMLTQHTRLLPVCDVARYVKKELCEETVRSIDSKYLQILDEDILLEQKPSGPDMELLVSFVYEEFMEYVIARALWAGVGRDAKAVGYKQIQPLAKWLLDQEHEFISVLGIIVYLGGFLARSHHEDVLKYIDWLVSEGRESLACRLIPQCPVQVADDSLFTKLVEIHSQARSRTIKLEAWKAMEKLCHHHWRTFFKYVGQMQLKGYFRPMFVFSTLARVRGGTIPRQQLETIRWIVQTMKNSNYIFAYKATGDYKNGVSAIKQIIANSKANWEPDQAKEAEKLLYEVESIPD